MWNIWHWMESWERPLAEALGRCRTQDAAGVAFPTDLTPVDPNRKERAHCRHRNSTFADNCKDPNTLFAFGF